MKEYHPSNKNDDFSKDDVVIYKKKYRNHWGRAFLLLFIILGLSFFLAFYALVSARDLLGLDKPDNQIEITITKDMSMNQVVGLLKDKNVIEQSFTFSVYAGIKSMDETMKPGTYVLNSNMAYDQIINAISVGDNVKDTVTITFYEGMTIKEIGRKLEENNVCDFDDFIKAVQTGSYDYDFISRIPMDEHRFRRLEGYMFPDTYEFFVGMNPEQVVRKFLNNFQKKLTPEIDAKIKNSGMSLDEIITLASIIQKEASEEEEMGKVSSVFHNRLESKASFPKLQSDVTIFYVEKDIKPFLNKQDQALYDAYNTYVCEGLPVAPISNPGLDAIMAAIEPEETPYYFFLTDANGKYYYAKTIEQHIQNDYQASKFGKTHGISTK